MRSNEAYKKGKITFSGTSSPPYEGINNCIVLINCYLEDRFINDNYNSKIILMRGSIL